MDRKEETREVKKFLKGLNYQNIKVEHGKGTAWGWLHLKVSIPKPENCYCTLNQYGQTERCHLCREKYSNEYEKIGNRVMTFTARTGDYGGRINIDIGWI